MELDISMQESEVDSSGPAPTTSSDHEPQDQATEYADPEDDVMTRLSGDQMAVGEEHRRLHQRVYLWTTSKPGATKLRSTNTPYDPTVDALGPEDDNTDPTIEELTPGERTKQYLVVGLVIRNEPDRYINIERQKAGGCNPKARKAREQRGVVAREPKMLRVVRPMGDDEADNNKLYAACNRTDNRAWVRIIKREYVYFFPEFTRVWIGKITKAAGAKKLRNTLLASEMTKWAAPREARVAASASASDSDAISEGSSDGTSPILPSITLLHEAIARCIGQMTGAGTGDFEPHAVDHFLDWSEHFDEGVARQLIFLCKPLCEKAVKWSPALILGVRKDLQADDAWLGQKLQRLQLLRFLQACHEKLQAYASREQRLEDVQSALATAELHSPGLVDHWLGSVKDVNILVNMTQLERVKMRIDIEILRHGRAVTAAVKDHLRSASGRISPSAILDAVNEVFDVQEQMLQDKSNTLLAERSGEQSLAPLSGNVVKQNRV